MTRECFGKFYRMERVIITRRLPILPRCTGETRAIEGPLDSSSCGKAGGHWERNIDAEMMEFSYKVQQAAEDIRVQGDTIEPGTCDAGAPAAGEKREYGLNELCLRVGGYAGTKTKCMVTTPMDFFHNDIQKVRGMRSKAIERGIVQNFKPRTRAGIPLTQDQVFANITTTKYGLFRDTKALMPVVIMQRTLLD